MTKKVVLYCRVSTKDQNCDRQISELRQIAKNHNYHIIDEYIDTGFSGSLKSRPELDRMMTDAFSKKFEMIMTLELSRIGRSTKNLLEIVEKLKEKDINLFIANQQIDTSTPSGSMFFTIASAFATYERDLIRERVISGLQNAKKKGVVLGRKTNLNGMTKNKIIEMKSQNIGLKKIAFETKVSVQSIRKLLSKVA
jgi:DNA invertase Pin-like site-specific DNA recombinase